MNKHLPKTSQTKQFMSVVVSIFALTIGVWIIYTLLTSPLVWLQHVATIVLLHVLFVMALWSLRRVLRSD